MEIITRFINLITKWKSTGPQATDRLCGLLLFGVEDPSSGLLDFDLEVFIATCGEVICDPLVTQKSPCVICRFKVQVWWQKTKLSSSVIQIHYQPLKKNSFFPVSCLSSPVVRFSWDLSMSEGWATCWVPTVPAATRCPTLPWCPGTVLMDSCSSQSTCWHIVGQRQLCCWTVMWVERGTQKDVVWVREEFIEFCRYIGEVISMSVWKWCYSSITIILMWFIRPAWCVFV